MTTKKVFLVCNAHLDPVWLWQWQEGLAETISTFRTAAQLCEEFDGFIFNHNESLLYEWIEQHEPSLFRKIQKLIKQKRWNIMGGWYLQPDCNLAFRSFAKSPGKFCWQNRWQIENPHLAWEYHCFAST